MRVYNKGFMQRVGATVHGDVDVSGGNVMTYTYDDGTPHLFVMVQDDTLHRDITLVLDAAEVSDLIGALVEALESGKVRA